MPSSPALAASPPNLVAPMPSKEGGAPAECQGSAKFGATADSRVPMTEDPPGAHPKRPNPQVSPRTPPASARAASEDPHPASHHILERDIPVPPTEPNPDGKPPPKAATREKIRLTSRQHQLLARLPLRLSSTELMELSDAGLRALMKANGIRRSNNQRRENYIEILQAWMTEDDQREMDLPSSVERVTRGEPASSASPPPRPPSPTCISRTP